MPSAHLDDIEIVDGLPNFYFETKTPNQGFAFQKGIHNVQKVVSPSGNERIPLIIISSTPRKAGSEDTPWHDRYDPDHGYVKYYGDNKSCKVRPESTDGNSILLELMIHYSSADVEQRRKYAVPVVFF